MEQTRIVERETFPIFVYYREIQATDLHTRTITETEQVGPVEILLGQHFQDWYNCYGSVEILNFW
jgi:hypothetical protein